MWQFGYFLERARIAAYNDEAERRGDPVIGVEEADVVASGSATDYLRYALHCKRLDTMPPTMRARVVNAHIAIGPTLRGVIEMLTVGQATGGMSPVVFWQGTAAASLMEASAMLTMFDQACDMPGLVGTAQKELSDILNFIFSVGMVKRMSGGAYNRALEKRVRILREKMVMENGAFMMAYGPDSVYGINALNEYFPAAKATATARRV